MSWPYHKTTCDAMAQMKEVSRTAVRYDLIRADIPPCHPETRGLWWASNDVTVPYRWALYNLRTERISGISWITVSAF